MDGSSKKPNAKSTDAKSPDRDEQVAEAHRLLMDEGYGSLLGVGKNGIALADLVEAPHRSDLTRYRLTRLRSLRLRRNRTVRLILQSLYVAILISTKMSGGWQERSALFPTTVSGWIVLGFLVVSVIYMLVELLRLVAALLTDARYASMNNIIEAIWETRARGAS
jgi:hypothetical protein